MKSMVMTFGLAVLVSACGAANNALNAAQGGVSSGVGTPAPDTQDPKNARQSFAVADVASLPACTAAIENQLAYAVSEKKLMTCAKETWAPVEMTAREDGESCHAAAASGGVNIICGTAQPVFIADGAAGSPGAAGRDGSDGVGCAATVTAGGVNITCGGSLPVFVAAATGPQGVAGSDGEDGFSVVSTSSVDASACSGVGASVTTFYKDVDRSGAHSAGDALLSISTVCRGQAGTAGAAGPAGSAGQDGLSARIVSEETCEGDLGSAVQTSGASVGTHTQWKAKLVRLALESGDQEYKLTIEPTLYGANTSVTTEGSRWNYAGRAAYVEAYSHVSGAYVDAIDAAGAWLTLGLPNGWTAVNVRTMIGLRYVANQLMGDVRAWMPRARNTTVADQATLRYADANGVWTFNLQCLGTLQF